MSNVVSADDLEKDYELRPSFCPFCGSANIGLWIPYHEPHIHCLDCKADGPSKRISKLRGGLGPAIYAAIILWNRRFIR